MSKLAAILARFVWWWMLWLMRRPKMKALQQRAMGWGPRTKRAAIRQSMIRQNRFARRFGLPMLTVTFNLLLASIVLTVVFQICLQLFDSGTLTLPDKIREKVEAERSE